VTRVVKFSRPVEVEIYINIRITKDTSSGSAWPTNGADLVRDALAAFIASLQIGQDVIVYPKLIASLNSIPGIEDVEIGIDTSPAPAYGTDDNITIAINEIAIIADAANDITVAVIP
jgi:uncharacterized phage protein gp47/JayE